MFALISTLILPLYFAFRTLANPPSTKYTVWSSVVFSRSGDRTPVILGDVPTQLTPYGAQQMYDSGSFFRQRYLNSTGSSQGLDSAPIAGINPDQPNLLQLYVFALDEQYTAASAQAFVQGLYPPYAPNTTDTEVLHLLDPEGFMANGNYTIAPLNGYQYAQIHVSGAFDPEFVYLGGNINCPAFGDSVLDYMLTPQFTATQAESKSLYEAVGSAFLKGVAPPDQWDYVNAYAIYDYLSYQAQHNASVAALFSDPQFIDSKTNISFLDSLRWYADQQQFAWLGNIYAANNITTSPWPSGVTGSISTISGNFLAAKIQAMLAANIDTQGAQYKLNLLFGDYQPLVSLFSLMQLPPWDSHFYGLPEYASAAVIELFSMTDASAGTTFPKEDELWVRFYFRNGTNPNEFQFYPVFGNDAGLSELKWADFNNGIYKLLIGDVGVWCQQCGAQYSSSDRVFCSYWNGSDSLLPQTSSSTSSNSGDLSPALAGVIGAIVALVVAGMLFGALMLIGGLRFYRNKSHKSEMGGFKGSQKLASDKDLTLPKGGAVIGATVEAPGSPVAGGHERVGSWELKNNDVPNIAASHPAHRPSFEEDDDIGDIGAAPFRPPTKPDERV